MLSYELTMTVNPKVNIKYYGKPYGKLIASDQWKWLKYHIYQILCDYAEFVIYPEFHKPPNYNLHIHGHVLIREDIEIMDLMNITKQLEEYGRTNFKPINSIDSWLEYIQKDYEKIKLRMESSYYDLQLGLYNKIRSQTS